MASSPCMSQMLVQIWHQLAGQAASMPYSIFISNSALVGGAVLVSALLA